MDNGKFIFKVCNPSPPLAIVQQIDTRHAPMLIIQRFVETGVHFLVGV